MGIVLKNVNITGGKLSSTVDAPSGWIRNPDWLPLPEITAADNRFVGLFLVFENEYNQLNIQATNNAALINWGDGNSVTSNGTVQQHVYNYSTISSPVKQYYDGRNYKQVIVDITRTSAVLALLNIAANSGLNNGGASHFGDILASLPETTTLTLASAAGRKLSYCERLRLINGIPSTYAGLFIDAFRVQVVELPLSHLTLLVALTNLFQRSTQNLKFFNNADLDIVTPVLGSMFNTATIKRVGNVSSTVLSAGNVFQNSLVEKVGNVNLPNATNMTNFAFQSRQMREMGVINAPNVTNLTAAFTTTAIRKIVFTDCSNVVTINTGSTGTFTGCVLLEELIMPGLTIGVNLNGLNFIATALNNFMTSLGNANGSQTLDFRNTPGAATCDTSIATNKGYTVQIA